MKRIAFIMCFTALCIMFTTTCFAYKIEVLQVGDISVFKECYEGFVDELAKGGIIQNQNLTINRHIIDAKADAGLWKKVQILLKIKSTASDILDAKPDLVLTIGTPATKYAKDKFISAGIPVVFTGVATPIVLGCPNLDTPGKGFTGSTLYVDPYNVMQIAKAALPNMKKMGIIHSDDDNAIAYAKETKEKSKKLEIEIITKEVAKSDELTPYAREMISQGVDSFGIPIDSYFDLNDGKATKDLVSVSRETKIPIIAFVTHSTLKGVLLYIGCDFHHIGALAGRNAIEILKGGKKPEDLPVLRQKDLVILVDVAVIKDLGVTIPIGILQLAKQI